MRRELSNSKVKTYKYNTYGKTPTQIQQELQKKGVRGFVVNINYNSVQMIVNHKNKRRNEEILHDIQRTTQHVN
ncbi:hypothetical protein [Staphylococcus canis]|uniref:Phage protein n=1 Tax=Staphylococcus canis TaxID=2724942 RepID=A0ABS0T8V3_9STAP|nr:hypothetical protein [Staphylococcus canis]MBI5975188.1 hypothetical protein [Staphylococcus canis]